MQTELYLIESNVYNKNIVGIVQKITKKEENVCYITLNKTYKAMQDFLHEKKIDTKKYFFVDLITPTIFKSKPNPNVLFADSIDDLNVFCEKILNFIKINKIKKVVFDSVSSFLVYKKPKEVLGFFDYLISFFEKLGIDMMLLALKEDENIPVVKQLKMRVQKTGSIGG